MAKVDIVIPCYNYARFLKRCVDSILKQSISDFRILIIDDASSDDSHVVAESLAMADSRISVISHSQNAGHINTYNEGIDWATSDYFLLLSADDLLVPGSLERAVRIMDLHPDVVLTYGEVAYWQDHSPVPLPIDIKDCFKWNRRDIIQDMCVSGENLVATPTAIGRTSAQKAIGGYQIDLPHSADMAMWLRFAAIGSVAQIHAVQAIYRRHSSNMSSSFFREKLPDYRQRKAAFDHLFDTNQNRLLNANALRTCANRRLAEKAYWTGVGQLLRGQKSNAGELLRFAIELNPRLYYCPPLQQLLQTPNLDKIFASIVGEAASHLLWWSKR
jgi:hypothetical protein